MIEFTSKLAKDRVNKCIIDHNLQDKHSRLAYYCFKISLLFTRTMNIKRGGAVNEIVLKDEDRFILNGLGDNCFMIAKSIEIGELVNMPIFFRGDVFQIDLEGSTVYKIGEKIIQASIKINTMWEEEQFES